MDGIRARGSASRGLQLGRVLLVTGGWSARLGVVFFFLTSDTMERSRPHLRLDDAACVYSTPRDCHTFFVEVGCLDFSMHEYNGEALAASACWMTLGGDSRRRIRARALLFGQRDASRGDARVQKMEESLAASVGWATHGVGSPVQLAGFSPLLVQFEIEWALSSGKIVFLSEQQLVVRDTAGPGCRCGLMDIAFALQ